MAYLFADGFDIYSATSDVTERWDSLSSSTLASLVASGSTAFGVGQALQFSTSNQLAKTLPSNEGTIFLNLRRKQTAGSSASSGFRILLRDGATTQCSIYFREDGSIAGYGGAITTLLGSTAAGVAGSVTWDSWQIKVVIHNTAGSIEVRKNGSSSSVLNLSSVNTRAGTANAYANSLFLDNSTSGSNPIQIDDLFVCSGSGAVPNDWPGDLRALAQTPSVTVQSQLSQSPTATTWGQLSSISASNIGANGSNLIQYGKVTAPFSGSVSTITLSLATSITGNLNAALYTDNAGVPGTLLSQSTGKLNPTSGAQVYTLAAPQAVTKNASYWVAIWCDVNTFATSNFNGVGSSISRMTETRTYTTSFPSSGSAAGSLSSGSFPYCSASLGSIDSVSLINDTTQDGDTSYVFGSTVGQQDFYSFPTLASLGVSPAAVTGVLPFIITRKSDSGARTISVQAKSGVTEVAAASNASPGLTYAFLGGWLSTDPNTSAAWTTAAVDALTIGPKVVA